jgi:hypothetical protein
MARGPCLVWQLATVRCAFECVHESRGAVEPFAHPKGETLVDGIGALHW